MSSNKFDVRKKNNLNFFPTLIQSKSHSNMGIKSNEKADKSIKTLKENEKNKNFFLNTVRNENKISNMKKANLKKSNTSLFENVFQTTLKENEKKNLTPSLSKDSFFNVDNKNLKHKKTIEINGFKRNKIKVEEKDIKTSLYDYNDLHNVNNGNLSDDLNKKNKKKIKINNKNFNVYERMGYYGHAFKLTIYYLCIIDDIKDKKYEYIMNQICDYGGDTDTNCAIVGTVIGPLIGYKNFSKDKWKTFINYLNDNNFQFCSALM